MKLRDFSSEFGKRAVVEESIEDFSNKFMSICNEMDKKFFLLQTDVLCNMYRSHLSQSLTKKVEKVIEENIAVRRNHLPALINVCTQIDSTKSAVTTRGKKSVVGFQRPEYPQVQNSSSESSGSTLYPAETIQETNDHDKHMNKINRLQQEYQHQRSIWQQREGQLKKNILEERNTID